MSRFNLRALQSELDRLELDQENAEEEDHLQPASNQLQQQQPSFLVSPTRSPSSSPAGLTTSPSSSSSPSLKRFEVSATTMAAKSRQERAKQLNEEQKNTFTEAMKKQAAASLHRVQITNDHLDLTRKAFDTPPAAEVPFFEGIDALGVQSYRSTPNSHSLGGGTPPPVVMGGTGPLKQRRGNNNNNNSSNSSSSQTPQEESHHHFSLDGEKKQEGESEGESEGEGGGGTTPIPQRIKRIMSVSSDASSAFSGGSLRSHPKNLQSVSTSGRNNNNTSASFSPINRVGSAGLGSVISAGGGTTTGTTGTESSTNTEDISAAINFALGVAAAGSSSSSNSGGGTSSGSPNTAASLSSAGVLTHQQQVLAKRLSAWSKEATSFTSQLSQIESSNAGLALREYRRSRPRTIASLTSVSASPPSSSSSSSSSHVRLLDHSHSHHHNHQEDQHEDHEEEVEREDHHHHHAASSSSRSSSISRYESGKRSALDLKRKVEQEKYREELDKGQGKRFPIHNNDAIKSLLDEAPLEDIMVGPDPAVGSSSGKEREQHEGEGEGEGEGDDDYYSSSSSARKGGGGAGLGSARYNDPSLEMKANKRLAELMKLEAEERERAAMRHLGAHNLEEMVQIDEQQYVQQKQTAEVRRMLALRSAEKEKLEKQKESERKREKERSDHVSFFGVGSSGAGEGGDDGAASENNSPAVDDSSSTRTNNNNNNRATTERKNRLLPRVIQGDAEKNLKHEYLQELAADENISLGDLASSMLEKTLAKEQEKLKNKRRERRRQILLQQQQKGEEGDVIDLEGLENDDDLDGEFLVSSSSSSSSGSGLAASASGSSRGGGKARTEERKAAAEAVLQVKHQAKLESTKHTIRAELDRCQFLVKELYAQQDYASAAKKRIHTSIASIIQPVGRGYLARNYSMQSETTKAKQIRAEEEEEKRLMSELNNLASTTTPSSSGVIASKRPLELILPHEEQEAEKQAEEEEEEEEVTQSQHQEEQHEQEKEEEEAEYRSKTPLLQPLQEEQGQTPVALSATRRASSSSSQKQEGEEKKEQQQQEQEEEEESLDPNEELTRLLIQRQAIQKLVVDNELRLQQQQIEQEHQATTSDRSNTSPNNNSSNSNSNNNISSLSGTFNQNTFAAASSTSHSSLHQQLQQNQEHQKQNQQQLQQQQQQHNTLITTTNNELMNSLVETQNRVIKLLSSRHASSVKTLKALQESKIQSRQANRAACTIQSIVRMFLAKNSYERMMHEKKFGEAALIATETIQRCWRGTQARIIRAKREKLRERHYFHVLYFHQQQQQQQKKKKLEQQQQQQEELEQQKKSKKVKRKSQEEEDDAVDEQRKLLMQAIPMSLAAATAVQRIWLCFRARKILHQLRRERAAQDAQARMIDAAMIVARFFRRLQAKIHRSRVLVERLMLVPLTRVSLVEQRYAVKIIQRAYRRSDAVKRAAADIRLRKAAAGLSRTRTASMIRQQQESSPPPPPSRGEATFVVGRRGTQAFDSSPSSSPMTTMFSGAINSSSSSSSSVSYAASDPASISSEQEYAARQIQEFLSNVLMKIATRKILQDALTPNFSSTVPSSRRDLLAKIMEAMMNKKEQKGGDDEEEL